MKGDFTRFTHRPADGYVGVLMQQGRVTLDADWNEQVAVDRRRWRRQTLDMIGAACAPEDHAGFGIEPTPDGLDLVITPGRIYVDGHLVELDPGTVVAGTRVGSDRVDVADPAPDGRALAPGHWVEVTDDAGGSLLVRIADVAGSRIEVAGDLGGLAESVGVRRVVTYLTQPFFPAAAAAPFGAPLDPAAWARETHLVYLDVWERHVTATEDPRLREVALGGPDTATRIQLAWAVRLLQDPDERVPVAVGDAGCGAALDAWDALTAPADGRMSARAEAPEDPLDPCVVPAEAGYRGLENRLYRVEVHDPGPLGTATFKWSRDNGTVLSAIRDFVPGAPFRVEVASLGRDRVLRFRAGDVVEAASDVSELAGQPGMLAEIDGQPDEARRLVPLDTDVSLYADHPRPRLRRWDHQGAPLTATGGWQELEDGVQVRFTGGPLRTGDWWVIPARTATGDVEGFVDAPPRGIEHSYARLGLVTWGDPTSVEDCRSTFATLCGRREGGHRGCCTITVGDGVSSSGDVDSLQEAVDAAERLDGPVRICLLPGRHRVDGPVQVRRSDLVIAGCGTQSPVVSAQGGVLELLGAGALRLERLMLLSGSEAPTVLAARVSDLTVVECDIRNRATREGQAVPTDPPEPRDPTLPSAGGQPAPAAGGGAAAPAVGADLHADDTVVAQPVQPVVAAEAQPVMVEVVAQPVMAAEAQPVMAEVVAQPAMSEDVMMTMDVAGASWLRPRPSRQPARAALGPALAAVRSAHIAVESCRLAGLPGVAFTGHDLRVADCAVGGGVILGGGSDTVEVRDSLLTGGPGSGVQLGVADLRRQRAEPVLGDLLEGGTSVAAFGGEGQGGVIAGVRVRGNTIIDCGQSGVGTPLDLEGAAATEVIDLVIADNRIADCGAEPLHELIGIGGGVVLLHASDVRVERNTVVGNGPRGMERGFALSGGVVVVDCHGLVVRDNVVRDNHAVGGPEVLSLSAGIVGAMVAARDADEDEAGGGEHFEGAATITGNDVHVSSGPAVVLIGAGAMTVARNNLVCRYSGGGLRLGSGRAMMLINLGAAPDTGMALGMWQYASPLRYGPVQIDGNQIVVHDETDGSGPLSPNTDWSNATAAQLLAGSAIMAVAADDLSIQGNQVANETAGEQARIAASVWAIAATLRTSGNRFDERAGSALFSYAGLGAGAHVVTGNIMTHCLRADGPRLAVSDNIELLCYRLAPVEHYVRHIHV